MPTSVQVMYSVSGLVTIQLHCVLSEQWSVTLSLHLWLLPYFSQLSTDHMEMLVFLKAWVWSPACLVSSTVCPPQKASKLHRTIFHIQFFLAICWDNNVKWKLYLFWFMIQMHLLNTKYNQFCIISFGEEISRKLLESCNPYSHFSLSVDSALDEEI